MYFNKFSSGTILALLALSGMLFLVPFAVPVHATPNASLPSIATTPSLVLQETPTALTEAVSNPASNAFAITTVTFIAPTGWNFTTGANVQFANPAATGAFCSVAGYGFTTVAVSLTAIECGTGTLPPGFTATFTGVVFVQGPVSPKSAAPVTGLFTTSVADASGSGAYPGPQWSETSIAGSGTLVSPAHTGEVAPTIAITGLVAPYTAGKTAESVTATLTAPSQVGVPVSFSAANGYPSTGPATTFTPSSGLTSATGVVTTAWQPSDHAGDTSPVTATITGSSGLSFTSALSVNTIAGAPTKVTFYLGGPSTAFPATDYVTLPVNIGGTNYADIPVGITYASTDSFGNAAGGVTGGTITAANGFFAHTLANTTCNVVSSCHYGTVPAYSQTGAYGAIGQISATLTGVSFSVSGTTGFIQTSTFAAGATFPYPAAATVAAGSTANFKLHLGTSQPGVPVVIYVCPSTVCSGAGGTSKGYSGTFSNGLSSITGTTNSTGDFNAVFTISSKLGATVVMNGNVTQPQNSGSQKFTTALPSAQIKTGPGAAAKLAVYATFGNGQTLVPLTGPYFSGPATIYATAGATLYIDAILTDNYGNIVTNTSPQQIQVNLAPSGVSGGGLLSVTTTYIAGSSQSTNNTAQGSFGPVAWTLPATLGASTVTASAVVAGNAVSGATTVTTISTLPTLNVKAPTPVSGVIYSASPFVTFSGKANASLGYPGTITNPGNVGGVGYPTAVTVTSLGYKVNSNHWISSSVAPGNKIVWSVPVTLATGLSTIQFNATDSKSNVVVSATYQVLVDSVAPTFTFAGTTTATGCEAVTVTSAAGDFNTASFTATYAGSPISSANIAWSGTQTLGSPSTLTATICGLVAGSGTLAVSGSTYAPISGSASETLTVTVVLADSITFNTGTATYGVIGAYKGVTVSVTNSWGSAQTVVIFATLKSGTSIYVAEGTATIAAGQTNAVVCLDLQTVPAGTYSVTFAAVTTSNAAVSAPVPGVNLVAT